MGHVVVREAGPTMAPHSASHGRLTSHGPTRTFPDQYKMHRNVLYLPLHTLRLRRTPLPVISWPWHLGLESDMMWDDFQGGHKMGGARRAKATFSCGLKSIAAYLVVSDTSPQCSQLSCTLHNGLGALKFYAFSVELLWTFCLL